MEDSDQLQAPTALQPGKEPGTHWNGASLDVLGKEVNLSASARGRTKIPRLSSS